MPNSRRCVAIVTDDFGWHGKRLRTAFASRGWATREVSLQSCHFDVSGDGRGLRLPGFERLPDAVFVRGVPGGTLEQITFHLDVLHALRHLGVLVYNDARCIERSVDKGMTTFLLHAAGLPTPPTWVARDPRIVAHVVERELAAGHELICKPLFGSQGEGLVRISEPEQLPSERLCNGLHYLQRFIQTGEGQRHCDWRVFVIGGRAVAAMRRESSGWITNVAQGAQCHPALLDPELRGLAEAASQTLGMAYAGVDILRDRAGSAWVNEVNGVPAWKGLQQVCNLDIAEALVADLLGRLRDRPAMEAVS